METRRQILAPTPDPESAPFWEAAQQKILLLRRCCDCQAFYWYPRAICPFCLGQRTEWVQSKGLGRIYSSTVMRKADNPYCIAYVELDEGPRVLTNIETDDPDTVKIGQRTEVSFVPASEAPNQNIPFFRLVTGLDG